jgi:hypothetical protein
MTHFEARYPLGTKLREIISGLEGIAIKVEFHAYREEPRYAIQCEGLDDDGEPYEEFWAFQARLSPVLRSVD